MKAVIYARYSSDNQREESIEGQLRECTAYCKKNNITIVRSYIDRALSAKTDNRPDFQRMIKDSAKGLFDVILVWKLDRFARNRYDSAHYKAALKKNGVKHIYARAIDNLHQSILEAFNLERILTPEKRAANDLTLELSLNTQCSTFNITKDFMVLKFTAPEKFVGHSYRSINFSRFGLVLISAVRKVTENNLLGLSSSREEILDLERKSMEEKIASRDEIIVMGTRKNITDFLSSVQTN